MRSKRLWQLSILVRWLILAVCSALIVIGVHFQLAQPSLAQDSSLSEAVLPSPQAHPLPPALAHWQEGDQGDYFSAVRPTQAGYLVWSEFPVKIYVEPGTESFSDRSQIWAEAVTQAVEEWSTYLSLEEVTLPEAADITIWRAAPPFQREGELSPRARSAETRYEIVIDRPTDAPARLSHRCTILLRPSQTADYIRAAARHELGHALGIWGHSPVETDALYFSQVRNPSSISVRDLNTLKRIYEQPTRLGWSLNS